ncbi:MAG: hypothetical protein KAI43_04705 [Candidatus Aureabacteria bacterium]|nr:hypothetical protein [Candidatus Auribacterota bacterium]
MLQKKTNILKLSLSILFFIIITAFCIHKLFNYDIWWHLRTGEYILKNRTVPFYDIFTYSVANNIWIDLHWFFQIIVYKIWCIAGSTGLIFAVVIFINLSFFIISRSLSPNISTTVKYGILLIAAFILEGRFFIRPELFSYVYLLLFLYVLSRSAKYSNKKIIFLLCLIQLLWVNTQGLFILGIYLCFCFFLEKLIIKREKKEITFGAILLLLVILVSFINPYGLKGLLFPLKLFTRIGPEVNLFRLNINEFMSPFATSGYLLYKVYAGLFIVLLILSFKKHSLHKIIFSISLFFLSVIANRNINIFVFASIPLVISGFDHLMKNKLKIESFLTTKLIKIFRECILTTLIIVYITCIYCVVSNRYYIKKNSLKRFGFGINNTFYPKKAVDFILDNNIRGRIFNDVGTGSYAIYRFYPSRKVYIDGRLEVMGDEHFNEHIEMLSDFNRLENFVEKKNFSVILFRFDPSGVKLMSRFKKLKKWKLVYFSHSGVVFLRKGERDDLNGILNKHLIELEENIKKRSQLKSTESSFYYNDPMEYYYYGKILSALGYTRLSILYLMEAIKINPDSFYIHRDAADTYLLLNQIDTANQFYNSANLLNPKDIRTLLGLTRVNMRKHNYKEAKKTVDKALKITPLDTTLLYYKGMICFELKDYVKARNVFLKITIVAKNAKIKAAAYFNLGLSLKKMGKEKESFDAFNNAFSLDGSLKKSPQIINMNLKL